MPANQTVIEAEIAAPIETVFDRLADHNRMGEWLAADITRTRESENNAEGVNGTGSVRTIRMFKVLEFDETVVRSEKPHTIEYRITRGSPLRNHLGRITLKQNGAAVAVHWEIVFDMAIPFTGKLTAFLLNAAIGSGLATLKKQLESR